jgi:hypothetical protein
MPEPILRFAQDDTLNRYWSYLSVAPVTILRRHHPLARAQPFP